MVVLDFVIVVVLVLGRHPLVGCFGSSGSLELAETKRSRVRLILVFCGLNVDPGLTW